MEGLDSEEVGNDGWHFCGEEKGCFRLVALGSMSAKSLSLRVNAWQSTEEKGRA